MSRRRSSVPTEGELEILSVLWERGPSTVRQIHNIIQAQRHRAYSTTLTMVQVMTEKGLLLRDDSLRPQVFCPQQSREQVQLDLVDYVIRRGFGGSAVNLVLRAVADRVDPEDLARIRQAINKARGAKS